MVQDPGTRFAASPPETATAFRAGLLEHVRATLPDGVSADVALAERDSPYLEAFSTPVDDPLVTALRTATGGEIRPFEAATEASLFAVHAPTVVVGPGVLADEAGPVAHSDREYVPVAAVERAATVIPEALRSFAS